MADEQNCPKCGAEQGSDWRGWTRWECGSYQPAIEDTGGFFESELCLRNQLAQRDAEIADLKAGAIGAIYNALAVASGDAFGPPSPRATHDIEWYPELLKAIRDLKAQRASCPDCGADYLVTGIETGCPCKLKAENGRLRGIVEPLDQLRADGWSVAVHNDYRQDGQAYTFWLFTRNGRAVKGEGKTDADALRIAAAAAAHTEETGDDMPKLP